MIDSIRQCFSKGSIAISNNGISVFYTYREHWVTQSVADEYIRVFADLLRSSSKFGIFCKSGAYIKFSFVNELTGQETLFYHPLTDEVSLEELQDILESVDSEKSREFTEFFMGTDLDDSSEVLEKLNEWIGKTKPKSNVLDLDLQKRFMNIQKLAEKFAWVFGCEIDVSAPGSDGFGYVEMQFPEDFKKPVWITGDLKDELVNIIEQSEAVTIEMEVNEGFLNITFAVE